MKNLVSTLFRASSVSILNSLKFKLSNINTQKVLLTGGIASYGFWFASTKIYNSDTLTFQTEDNLQQGEVRQIKVGPKDEDTILVISYQGKVYSIQSKCSHYGFNLAKGLLIGDKIICPLHNAAFKITSGQQEQGPVYSGLKTFPVERKNGKIIVTIPKQGWDHFQGPRQYTVKQFNKNKKIVIVGGGPAALSAVDSLRQNGYDGLITVVSQQKYLPYDRTGLSKGSDPTKPPGPIRDQAWFTKNGVQFVGETTVTGIDYKSKQVKTNKNPVHYDKLLLATGSVNRYPPIKGLDQVKFFSLRGIDDYKQIGEAVRQNGAKNITIVGGGFIGMEIASALKLSLKDQVNVTVLEATQSPLKGILGDRVGKALQSLSQKNGVNVVTSAKIKEIAGNNNRPKSVVLQGKQVPTDVLIMATGVRPAVDFAPQLVDKQNNGIKTNVYLQTDHKDVFAAGDIASYPYWYNGKRARIEHFNEAIYQGSVAGMNMAGRKFPMDNIPFFWTRQFNNSLVFSGINQGWDEVHISGNPEQLKFIAYYIDKKNDKVLGAAAMGQMNKIQIINEAMRNGVMPKASVVKSNDFNIDDLLKDVKSKNPKCTRCGI